MRSTPFARSLGAVLALSTVLVACEDDVTDIPDPPVEGEITIDASNPVAFTYFSFTDGGAVVPVTDPSTDAWDMAFRRFTVKLNGGVSGPGSVAGLNLENNAALDSAAVLALTEADADSSFAAVTEDDLAGAIFIEDAIVADPAAWLFFGPMGPAANPTAAWKMRLRNGEHGLVRAIGLTLGPAVTATFEMRHQPLSGTLGTVDTLTVDLTSGAAFIDIQTASSVLPAGCNHDLQVMPLFGDLAITVNDACGVGTFPLDVSEDFSAVTVADDAPEYGAFLSVTAGAFPAGFDGPEGVFWYNIDGSMRLFPTQNVFLVQVGTAVYKVQMTDYYNSTGDSGFPTMRFEQLR